MIYLHLDKTHADYEAAVIDCATCQSANSNLSINVNLDDTEAVLKVDTDVSWTTGKSWYGCVLAVFTSNNDAYSVVKSQGWEDAPTYLENGVWVTNPNYVEVL